VDEDKVSWEYSHQELALRSIITRWMEGVDTKSKYFKKARLPLKYMRRLFKNTSPHPMLLYSAQSVKAWIAYNYFILAMVYPSSDTIDIFQKKIKQSLNPMINTYAVTESYSDNGKKVVCHKY
jgi:hypothetical protein